MYSLFFAGSKRPKAQPLNPIINRPNSAPPERTAFQSIVSRSSSMDILHHQDFDNMLNKLLLYIAGYEKRLVSLTCLPINENLLSSSFLMEIAIGDNEFKRLLQKKAIEQLTELAFFIALISENEKNDFNEYLEEFLNQPTDKINMKHIQLKIKTHTLLDINIQTASQLSGSKRFFTPRKTLTTAFQRLVHHIARKGFKLDKIEDKSFFGFFADYAVSQQMISASEKQQFIQELPALMNKNWKSINDSLPYRSSRLQLLTEQKLREFMNHDIIAACPVRIPKLNTPSNVIGQTMYKQQHITLIFGSDSSDEEKESSDEESILTSDLMKELGLPSDPDHLQLEEESNSLRPQY